MNNPKSIFVLISAVSLTLSALSTYGATFEVPASATTVYRVGNTTDYSGAATGAADGYVPAGHWGFTSPPSIGNGFVAFQLPDIGGQTISKVELTFQYSGANGAGPHNFGVDLYGMGLNASDGTIGNTYASYFGFTGLVGDTHPQAGELLKGNFINTSLTQWQTLTFEIDVAYLTDLYDGYNGTDYMVLRTSPNAGISNVLENQRIHFAGIGNTDGNFVTAPVLTITTVPEPSTYAALLGALALLGMIVRRRKVNQ